MSGHPLPAPARDVDVSAISSILGNADRYYRVELTCMLCGRAGGSFLSIKQITSVPYRQCREHGCGGKLLPDEYSVVTNHHQEEMDISAYFDGPRRGRPSRAVVEQRRQLQQELFGTDD
jgi:hypothetical protein